MSNKRCCCIKNTEEVLTEHLTKNENVLSLATIHCSVQKSKLLLLTYKTQMKGTSVLRKTEVHKQVNKEHSPLPTAFEKTQQLGNERAVEGTRN